MSTTVELRRPLDVPGPAALAGMLQILNAVSTQAPPYERTALSLGLDAISVPIRIESIEQSQRYECEIAIAAAAGARTFPRFKGTMSISPQRDQGSELWLQGSYTVPFGAAGEVVDETLLHGVATHALDVFVAWMANEIAAHA